MIGAGPVGLCTAFWAGMREADARIIDSLPELGGQLTTLYPEKWIFDVPGHPKVLAKDLVEMLRSRRSSSSTSRCILNTTAETIRWEDEDRVVVLHTDRGELRSRTVIVAGGHGAFEPKKLPGYDMTPWEGRGAHYIVGEKSVFAGQAGDDRRRRRLGLRLGDQPARHGERDQPRAPPRGFPRARADGRPGARGGRSRRRRRSTSRFRSSEVTATARVEGVRLFRSEDEAHEIELEVDAILLQLGFKTALGPLKDWGFEVIKGAIVVDPVMKTSLRACGRAATSRPSTASSS